MSVVSHERTQRTITWVEIAVSVTVLFLPALIGSAYQTRLLENIAIFALLAMGLNLAFGFTGQISLGHAAFYAVGAYGSGLMETKLGLPIWIAWPAAILLCMVLGYLISLPVMRLSGHFLALATLAFGLIVETLIAQGGSVTGGHDGIIIPVRSVMGEFLQENFTFVIVGVAVVSYWILRNLTNSSVGRALRATRDDADGASALGISVSRSRIMSVVVGAGLAGVAGIFYAHVAQVITPEVFAFHTSIQILMMVVIGGMGHRLGGVLGAAVVILLPEFLWGLEHYQHITFGVLVLIVLLFAPKGVAGLPAQLTQLFRRGRASTGGVSHAS